MDELTLKALIGTLQSSEDSLGFWFHLSSALVVVGVIAETAFVIQEYWDDLESWKRGIVRVPDRPHRSWFAAELVGVALVAVGVTGELFVDIEASSLETQIRNANARLVFLLEQRISGVAESAQNTAGAARTAQASADAAKDDLDQIHKRVGVLNRDIDAQGPRWRLLFKAAPALIEELSPFSGQQVLLAVSGSQSTMEPETGNTWGDIAGILNADGAKWNVERGGLVFLERWASEQGIKIVVNSAAPSRTQNAARALSEGLSRALPPSPDKMLVRINPDFATQPWNRQWVDDKENPVMWVLNDPDLIVVTIGRHPQQQENEPNNRTIKKRFGAR
ncbi:MAG: hypothetical protein WCA10_10245 [Terracidiphilus sp.]